MRRVWLATAVISFVWLSACAPKVQRAFRAAQDSALSSAPAPTPGWEADARLHIDNFSLLHIVRGSLEHQLGQDDGFKLTPLNGLTASVSPKLGLDGLSLAPSSRCSSCLELSGVLGGALDWDLGPWNGRLPVAIEVSATVAFEAVRREQKIIVSGSLKSLEARPISALILRPGGTWKGVRVDLEKPLGRWLNKRWLQGSQAIPVARIDGLGRVIREARIHPSTSGLDIDMYTEASSRAALASVAAPVGPAMGWTLSISQTSAMSLLRQQAFAKGPLRGGVYIDPLKLVVSDQQFRLLVRLWKPGLLAWWRGYRIHGELHLSEKGLSLEPTTVDWLTSSPRARMIDPLASLAEARILRALGDTLQFARPTVMKAHGAPAGLQIRLHTISADESTVQARGSVRAKPSQRANPNGEEAK